jgi:tetratricopeptide (TPR) repeat protein
MSHSVFISYARQSSRRHAKELQKALGGEMAFLDTSHIETGERFPAKLVDALLSARVLVLFADETYFQRWYCLWELRTSLTPHLQLRTGASEAEKNAALASIVIALPARGGIPGEFRRLPPLLRNTHWPNADQVLLLSRLVHERLEATPHTLAERIDAAGGSHSATRMQLLEDSALPPPLNLAGFKPIYPLERRPSLGDAFKGRADELWRIDFTLSTLRGEDFSGAALTGALEGGGGFGKTQLALEYLHRLGVRNYPGGIFWVDADVTSERLEEQLHGILHALRPQVPDLPTFLKQERKVSTELAAALDEAARLPVLYIVDNVPESPVGAVPKPLNVWCPALGKVALLVTSRAKLALGVEGVHSLPIDTLSSEAAVALLTDGVAGASPRDPEWRRIAEWVGYLPLALELLNRSLKVRVVTREQLLALLTLGPVQTLDRQTRALQGSVPEGVLRGVTDALSVSYNRLPKPAQRMARLLARLAPEPIPTALLESLEDEDSASEVRVALTTRHFVTPVASMEEGGDLFFGSMHRVLADFLRSQQPTTRRKDLGVLCKGLLSTMDADAQNPKAWPLLRACLPHSERVFDDLQRSEGKRAEPQILNEVRLGLRIGATLRARGLLKRAREFEHAARERALQFLGPEHLQTLVATNNLATTLHAQGNRQGARSLLEHCLESSQRILGPEHGFSLQLINNLAQVLSDQGEYPSARALQEQALPVCRRILGEHNPVTLSSINNLAQTYLCQGESQAARSLLEPLLDNCRHILGEAHQFTLTVMNNLALALIGEGHIQEARQLQGQVVTLYRDTLGEEHPHTLKMTSNFAGMLWLQGELQSARELLEQELVIYRRTLGEDHPETLEAMTLLIRTLMDLGESHTAWVLQEPGLNASRRVLGEDHPVTLFAMGNLAMLLYEKEKFQEARAVAERGLEACRRVLGEEHLTTLMMVSGLALVLHALKDFPTARALQEHGLALSRRLVGDAHPLTLTSMNNLALTLLDQGAFQEAQTLMEQGLETSQRILGREHLHTIKTMGNLAVTLSQRGQHEKARTLSEQVVEDCQRVLGETHPYIQVARKKLEKIRVAQDAGPGIRKFLKRSLKTLLQAAQQMRQEEPER